VGTVSERRLVPKLDYRGLVGLAGLFLIWEGASRVGLVPDYYVPPPSVVLPTLGRLLTEEDFLLSVVASVLAMAIALATAIAIAVPTGLVLGSVATVRKAVMVLVEFLRPLPSVALIPLALLVFGTGPDTKIGLAAFAAVWPILFNTMYALAEIDPLQVQTARAFGTGRVRVLATVALPNAAPFVLTGIRLSASIALAVVVSVELLAGGSDGIGRFVLQASSGGLHMDEVLAATVLTGAIGYLINAGLERLHRGLFAWNAPHEVSQ
jgi:NitT/TauT family transport system permease protein